MDTQRASIAAAISDALETGVVDLDPVRERLAATAAAFSKMTKEAFDAIPGLLAAELSSSAASAQLPDLTGDEVERLRALLRNPVVSALLDLEQRGPRRPEEPEFAWSSPNEQCELEPALQPILPSSSPVGVSSTTTVATVGGAASAPGKGGAA